MGRHRPFPRKPFVTRQAPALAQFAVHVEQAPGPCPLVKVIDILSDDEQVAGPLRIEPGQRDVGGVGLDLAEAGAPGIVE